MSFAALRLKDKSSLFCNCCCYFFTFKDLSQLSHLSSLPLSFHSHHLLSLSPFLTLIFFIAIPPPLIFLPSLFSHWSARSWFIAAFVPWFVNVGQLIVVWKSCVAGGLSILYLCMCAKVHACLHVWCLTVFNRALVGINTSSFSSVCVCVQTGVTSSNNKTHTWPLLSCWCWVFKSWLHSAVANNRPKVISLMLQETRTQNYMSLLSSRCLFMQGWRFGVYLICQWENISQYVCHNQPKRFPVYHSSHKLTVRKHHHVSKTAV